MEIGMLYKTPTNLSITLLIFVRYNFKIYINQKRKLRFKLLVLQMLPKKNCTILSYLNIIQF